MRRRVIVTAWCILPLLASAVLAQPAANDAFEACVRHLHRAVIPQRDGSHLPRLFALRQLRDQTLRPLFYQLAQRDDWQIQVHSILGLAEISDDGCIDPWLVTRVNAPAQEALIANAIDMDLIGEEQIDELLAWDDLQSTPRLLLIGEKMLSGRSIDEESLARLAQSANHRVAGLASLILAQLGDSSALVAFARRLDDLPRRDRQRHLLWLFEAVRQYRATAAMPWLREVLANPDLDPEVAYWGIYAALVLDPVGSLPIWEKHLGQDPSHRDLARFGMLLLAAGEDVPAEAYSRLTDDSELIRRMTDAGAAISSGSDPTDELIALIDLKHLKTAKWAMGVLEDLPADQAAKVYEHVIDAVNSDQIGRAERVSRAVEATSKHFKLDPQRVLARLSETEDDSLAQEVLLLGLFDSYSPAAGDAARLVRRIGAGRSDSLALLLIARHAETLGDDDLRQLGMIASGGGRVSEGLQVQAAWLYLKHTNAIDQSLSCVFDSDS